jgi:hypothetical protein
VASYRRYARLFALFFLLFLLLNLAVWLLWTRNLLSGYGDLARLGYYAKAKVPRGRSVDLPRRHLEPDAYHGQRVDLVTIGDSFSAGHGGGRNPYYQDYIASYEHLTVLNLSVAERLAEPVETLVKLLNNGFLGHVRPKNVLLELVERRCLGQLARNVDFSLNEPLNAFFSVAGGGIGPRLSSRPDPVSAGNLKFLYYSLMYCIRDNPTGQVYVKRLDREFFSGKGGDELLFYADDLDSARMLRPADVAAINANLNRIAEKLAAKGIGFYFMPVVDKSNLYRNYVLDSSVPRSVFFEELRRLPKKYVLIDTKAILSAELARGEKDIYFADDTHWTWKASEKIFGGARFGTE